jgi:hypothetical protein
MADKLLVTDQKRKQVETFIYKLLDTVDPSHTNSDYYRGIFSQLDNNEFYHFFERRLPIRFHYEIFKIEPKMYQIVDAFKIMKKPLLEKINLPHVYRDKNGVPVQSQECLVIYIHIKRLKQMLAAKSHIALNTSKRDMRTGLLTGEDKGAKEIDREFEALAADGLEYTMDEFSRPRADSLKSAAQMNDVIMNKGFVSEKDFNVDQTDSLAKNMLNVYLIAANIHSNLVDTDYMTPYTAANIKHQVNR